MFSFVNKVCFYIFAISLLSSDVFAEHISDKNKYEDDVIVPMPCNQTMVFRKIYTGSRARASRSFIDQNKTKKVCTVQGAFEDNSGFYYLLSKYELTEYQYKILTESKCPTFKKILNIPAVLHTKDEFNQAALKYSAFLQKTSNSPNQQGIKAVASLPLECDWSFALRGGLKVSEDKLSDKFPFTVHNSENIKDFAWVDGASSANDKLQMYGRLKPNILGLFDMLGNAQEIMADSQHGGNVTVRGGGIYTPSTQINNETRFEKPLFSKTGDQMKAKDTGTRFELTVPVHLSLKDVARKDALELLKNQEEERIREQQLSASRAVQTSNPKMPQEEKYKKEIGKDTLSNKKLTQSGIPAAPAKTHTNDEKISDLDRKQLEKKCNSNNAQSCSILSNLYINGDSVRQDYNKAKLYSEKACELDDGLGCGLLGWLYYQGKGTEQFFSQAKFYFERACNLNSGLGCSNLGNLYRKGLYVNQDFPLAKQFYEKGCLLNHGMGCAGLGILYSKGQGIKKDFSLAKAYYEKACKLNDGAGFTGIGYQYNYGHGVEKNNFLAKDYYIKACNLNDGLGCYYLGYLYEEGQGVDQDYALAHEYYKKACDLTEGAGCHGLGFLYSVGLGVKKDDSLAKSYFEKEKEFK